MGIEAASDAVPRRRRARLRSIAATMIETRWCAAQWACAADYDTGVVRGQCGIGGKPAAGTAQRSRLVRGNAASRYSSTVRWRARLRKRSVACDQDQTALATGDTVMQVDARDAQHEGGRGLGFHGCGWRNIEQGAQSRELVR